MSLVAIGAVKPLRPEQIAFYLRFIELVYWTNLSSQISLLTKVKLLFWCFVRYGVKYQR